MYSVINCVTVTPFSLARHSSLRKEGKSASWISLSLSSDARLASPVLASSFAHRTGSFQSRRPSGNPLLEFWRSVGLVFHFEILRISPFHRPTPHGAFTSFSPAKIRFLDYSALCAPVIRSKILRIFSLISELEMLRVSGFALTLPKIRYNVFF